jgi:hypothetical protein
MYMECFGMLMDGRAQPTGVRKLGEDGTLLTSGRRNRFDGGAAAHDRVAR